MSRQRAIKDQVKRHALPASRVPARTIQWHYGPSPLPTATSTVLARIRNASDMERDDEGYDTENESLSDEA